MSHRPTFNPAGLPENVKLRAAQKASHSWHMLHIYFRGGRMIRKILFAAAFCAALVYLTGRALDIEAAGDAQRIEKFKHMRFAK